MDRVYILFFNEYEANNVLGVFSTFEEANKVRQYLLDYPPVDSEDQNAEYSYLDSTLAHHALDPKDYAMRLAIAAYTLDKLTDDIKIDNLRYLEMKSLEQENER